MESYEQFKSKPFLHCCLSLQKYSMLSLGQDRFKWAVQRDPSKDLDQDRHQGQDRHDGQVRPAPYLPPLEDIIIHQGMEPFGSEFDDIGLRFGATLKPFTIHGQSPWSHLAELQPVRIGCSWKIPDLALDLSFQTTILTFCFD